MTTATRPSDEELCEAFGHAIKTWTSGHIEQLRAVADLAIQWERSRAAEQRPPESEAVTPTVEEWEALECAAEESPLAHSAYRKLNARAGDESSELLSPEVTEAHIRWLEGGAVGPDPAGEAGGTDEDGARRMFEHAERLHLERGHIPRVNLWENETPQAHEWQVNAYRFVRSERDAEVERLKRELEAAREQIAMRGDSEVQRRLSELQCKTLDEVAPMLGALGKERDALAEKVKAVAGLSREDFHMTYNGGHHEPATHEAFHHGMDTVFNALGEVLRSSSVKP